MKYIRKAQAIAAIFTIVFSSISCTTMKPVSWTEPAHIASQIEAGDKIEYRTSDGNIGKLKITSVNSEMIQGISQGKDKTVLIADIISLEKKEIDALKTTGLILGITAGIVIFIIAAVSSMDLSTPEP